ncbi:Uncharacterized conserved protein UCP016719 [Leptonema illini DSM 21528]|uniref:Uncharacterized conserved protein UCP016719 n=2 Tax=Leptonema illini TaxID=183 RepID=H2CA34_9LEPT|nr:Uncharacterized conserved protein UCP016719 [Leptonema illini DSM 21528]
MPVKLSASLLVRPQVEGLTAWNLSVDCLMLIDPVDRLLDVLPREMRVGLLANQVSFSFARNRYSFEVIPGLERVFLPEHGLFAELQDQIPIDSVSPYRFLRDVQWVSLYGERESSLLPDASLLKDLDMIIVDVQDVGARYYTFLTSVFYTMQVALTLENPPAFCIVDRPNPAGRAVEGTPLQSRYASFVGVPGVPHRHGLTAAELLLYYRDRHPDLKNGHRLKFAVIPYDHSIPIKDETGWLTKEIDRRTAMQPPWTIPPSPNMPSPITPLVYAGQCLLEGTNLSEGRGTTRPFEIFGAPYIDENWMMSLAQRDEIRQDDLSLRPLRFIPTFHKFAGSVCNGWQLLPLGRRFHSLLFSLALLRLIKERFADFAWRTETYEYRDDLLAIEMLAGDDRLLEYLNGRGKRSELQQYLEAEELRWVEQAQPYVLYADILTPTVEQG